MKRVGESSESEGATSRHVEHRALFESAPCGMLVVDPTDRVAAANAVAAKLLSTERAALVGRSFCALVATKDRARVRSMLREHGPPRELQIQMKVRRRKIEVVVTIGSADEATSRAVDAVIVLRSATALEVTSDDRRQANKMEALGRLAGGIAHDFSTALAGIAGCADVALRRIDEGQSARDYIVEIKDATLRAAAMPRKLVDFSRSRVTALTVFDVSELLRKLEPGLRRMVGDDVELVVSSEEPALIRGDDGQLGQMVTNLVANAKDAIDQAGAIVVQTQRTDIARSSPGRLRYLPPGPYVCVSVRDSGRGMDEGTLARIFEPFFSTKDEAHGTGLGLSMVAATVEAANGHIETTSEPMNGTTVFVYIPEVESPKNRLELLDELEGHETILILEDDQLVRTTIRDSLEYRGYRVLEADCGTEALRQSRMYPGAIHLVLADLVLPGINGLEAVRMIRIERPDVRAVFMSASYPTADASLAQLDRGRNFIEKPFDEVALAALLRQSFDAAHVS